jgi:hypothetical protein
VKHGQAAGALGTGAAAAPWEQPSSPGAAPTGTGGGGSSSTAPGPTAPHDGASGREAL